MNFCFQLTLAFVLVATSFAQINPLKDPNICGRPICEGQGKFKYGPNTQQIYQYSVEVKSMFKGTSKNESKILIEGNVTLDFITHCDGLLTLSDFQLSENFIKDNQPSKVHVNSLIFGEALSEHTTRFSFHDGIISEVCPHEEEKNWILNFKRGILSMFHNTMKRFDLDYSSNEKDVKGKCFTQYKVIGTKETSLLIEKTKDLSNCENRSKLHSMVQSVPYNLKSKTQGENNLLKSTNKCQMSVDHNIYNSITCEESYIFKPFSNDDAGASTFVVQKLDLISENSETVPEQEDIFRRTSLLYDHIPTPKPTQGELKMSRELMKKMCKQSTDDVQIEFSDLFTKFIQSLRVLSYPSLSVLYGHAGTTCSTGKKHLMDALPYVGNTASVIVMKDIILKREIPESVAKEWMMSLAFIARPDTDMMEAGAQLLQQKPFEPNIILSVAALTHTFCSQNSKCILNESIYAIVKYIENSIIDFYMALKKNKKTEQIIIFLKALGNIGIVSEGFKQNLFDIIENNGIDVAIRIIAVETFRRLPCDENRYYFERLFRNQNENVEVRIASYLNIMQCPNYLLIRTIKHSLEIEEVNQVGSFIWSHLNNLLKSAIPSRVEIQSLLSDIDLIKKFSSDARKFSHNREGSIFFEEYNIGGNYDSNIIFSPSSYVPKSAMLNLTVDIFGESINFLELYGRAEGFEHYLESVFGPKGALNSKKIQEKVSKLRWSRSVSEEEALENEIEKLPNVMENTFGEPKVSLGFKVFGNDLKYATFNGDDEIKAALRTLNPVDHLKRILSGKEINYNKAAMFLDSNYVVPSGAGLPISLNVVGTASINLKLFGSLHAAGFIKTKELDLKADIRPSISFDLTGSMCVDAFYTTAGIKLRSSMYTSSAIEGAVKIRGPKLVNVKFSIPRQTSEIFGVKSELLIVKDNSEELQSGLLKNRVSKSICTWPAVDKTVGLKLCGEYHFMNVTKINKAPYFILAGPSGLRLFLDKSDPTAKIYLFEYKWTDKKNSSAVSLTFDTPGSSLRRLLAANFTVDKQSQNLTLLLQSTEGILLAKGKYKNTKEEKYLQLILDINNRKHFDFSTSLIRQDSRHGYTYFPKIYLGVNSERVLELQGTLKLMSKKGISQYDVDLKFQTKRLTSKLFGYISKAEASVAANLKLDYKFAHTKEQRVMFEFTLANRSPKNMVDIRGTCNLFSTSYPNFNFDAKFKFQRGAGPIECKLDLNSSPLPENHPDADLHRLKFEWLFSYKSLLDSTRTLNTIVSVHRQSTGLNLKGQFSYETKGPDINVLLLVKYANDKEVSITVFWSHPHSTLEQMEGRVNITLPSFTSMILQGKLQEKAASDFIVDVSATWFSGHSISARGFYQDKSSTQSLNHHLKLLIKSPSFEDINTDLQFYRNDDELKFDFKAFQNIYNYTLFMKHNVVSENETTAEVKIKYKTKNYSMLSSIYSGDHRQISVEFHIDQIRDIHFAAWEYNKETYKAAGLEVKWDANRDNNQKLVVSANFTKVSAFNYKGNFLISYPGRTILSNLDFLLQDHHFDTLIRLSWADQQSFAVGLLVDYETGEQTLILIKSQIVTPFIGWQKTSVSGSYHHTGNMYRINGSIFWKHNEHVTIDLFEDYSVKGSNFDCTLKGSLTSTFENIPSLSANLKHNHNASKVNSHLKLMYDPKRIIDVKSNWEIAKTQHYTNLTGTIVSTTPFNGFNRGYLISKIHYTKTKYIRGFADLDLDHKKFIISVEGNLQKLTNSMLEFNVTTPMEKYRQLAGRFGFSEERRHIVAEITYPSGIIGFEVLLSIESIINFDIKFSLATPISFLQQIIIIGKLKPDRADFRIGWNLLLLGFSGVWHYVNVIDFEYSYKIYTPIEGFEENGFVAKLILKEGLDSEISIKLSEYKLGTTILGRVKPKILKELGIKTQNIYGAKQIDSTWSDQKAYDDYDDEGNDYDDPISWTGFIEIDAIIYPTIQGTLDIDQEGPLYILQGKLSLPEGIAHVNDEFEFVNLMSMRNDLHITTPYDNAKTIVSNFNLNIVPNHNYKLSFNLDYQNNTSWVKSGILAGYIFKVGENEQKTYNVTLQIDTPLESFPQLDVHAALETEGNIYMVNLSATTNSSHISVTTKAKIYENLLDTVVFLIVKTPVLQIPSTKVNYIRGFSVEDNSVEVNIFSPEILKKDINFHINWFYNTLNKCHMLISLKTPYKGMETSSGGIQISVTDKATETWLMVHLHPLNIETNSTISGNIFQVVSDINFNGKNFPLLLNGNIKETQLNRKDLSGILILKNKTFHLSGIIYMREKIPDNVELQLKPDDNSDPVYFEYRIQSKGSHHILTGSLKHSQKFVNFDANITTKSKLDWQLNLKLQTSHQFYNKFSMQANATTTQNGNSISINVQTPIPKLENPKLGASVISSGQQRFGRAYFDLVESKGSVEAKWIWLFLENMNINIVGNYQNIAYKSTSKIIAFYFNPNQSFKYFQTGGDVIIDSLWSAGSNLTFSLSNYQDMELETYIKFPKPIKEIYYVKGKLNYDKGFKNVTCLGKYSTIYSRKNYGVKGNISLIDKAHMGGSMELEWNNKYFRNYIDLRQLQNNTDLLYKLQTPKFLDKDTFVTKLNYKNDKPYHNLTSEVFYPGNKTVVFAKIDFQELSNMNGTINVTIPFKNITYIGSNFLLSTNAYLYKRYVKVFWPNDSALLNCKCITKTGHSLLERNTTGVLLAEIPLTTRHVTNINFDYKEKPYLSKGSAIVDYNGNKVLDGKYNCLSESWAGFDKDTIHVEVENKLIPIGADYVHEYKYGDNSNASTVDKKDVHLFNLHNSTKFNITGKIDVKTTSTGRNIALTVTHSNRTVKLLTDYDVLNQQFKQHSHLEIGHYWLEYDLNLLNNTKDEIIAQLMQMNVAYPRRNFTFLGSYKISELSLSTNMSLSWDKNEKIVQAGLDWRRTALHREEIQLEIKHPSFERDVVFLGEYDYDNKKLLDAQLTVNYSLNPEQTLKLGTKINDNSNALMYNYTYNLFASHAATNLNLNTRGGFYWNPTGCNTGHYTDYKRSYLPLQTAEALARVNFSENEIELKRKTGHDLSYLWTRYVGVFPIYTTNISVAHEMNNASGEFYLNLNEKLVRFDYNITTDGSQSLHMYGFIPDARSVVFDIWRDYEDIRVTDIAYYLKLNHSRLITSCLEWRPELIYDIQSGTRNNLKQLYNNLIDGINNTKQYIRAETNDAIHSIWYDAKPLVQQFIDDLRDLKVIESDFKELKIFLNESYNANDFYIRDIVNVTMIMFDELTLKSHIESLPAIVSEIWQVMGASGKKIKKSIIWVLEKIKMYYKNTADFFHNLLEGDPIDHLSEAFKKIVEKYDEFIKEMHVSFIQYMERLWKQTYTLIIENWHRTLAAVEPTFLKIVHYLETIVWNTGREFLDFLYIRKSEIIESPYFVKFTNFTHDIDRFYKDITGNNTIASITKYVKITWNFLKEKYFSMIPFGKELKEIMSEILDELNELRKLPSIQYIEEKYHKIYSKIKWFYDYFEMEYRIHHFITLLHIKLTDMSLTALEAENRYREAKTKFIFEPSNGIMLLEQKLPISWHAFNETPKFQEIPELKRIYDLQSYFIKSRSSFSDFYYDYKPYTEISGWLPPFNAQALLIGSKYFVTFDRKYYNFSGSCSYLLATDYLDRNFSIIISYDNNNSHELLLLINNSVVHINTFNNKIKIDNNEIALPIEIADTLIYNEAEIITVKSDSFMLLCNLRFNVCSFEVSGWYFGKTAGLWGTINNEPSDDFLTSQKYKAQTTEVQQFANSWALQNCQSKSQPIKPKFKTSSNIQKLCDEFFSSSLSQLSTCFSKVSKDAFANMCLTSVTEEEACSSVVAYVNLCEYINILLRIPDICVKCKSLNGTTINEGQFIHVENSDIPKTADIVFIIEAKDCNKNITANKNVDLLVELIHKELTESNITNNRYSVVVFGGNGVFDQPRSIAFSGNIFTDHLSVIKYFDKITTGDGNSDVFGALTFATKLLFKAGVSKNFILIPCSECRQNNMKLDYAILHQLLLESDVTLHILMDEEFSVQKTRENKTPFGIDSGLAFTKKDMRVLRGDAGLRRQVSLPKSVLGYCTPLALETNGSIFSSKNLEFDKRNLAKKFLTVFAKRIVSTAKTANCIDCECTAFNTGVSFMECYPCTYPMRTNIDYGFDEDEALFLMQPVDDILDSSMERRR